MTHVQAKVLAAILGTVLLPSLFGAEEPTRFLRFEEEPDQRGRLETAIVRYRDAEGVEIDLVAAVHIGDRSYYRELDRRFRAYDVVLYEMIKDKDVDPSRDGRGDSLLSLLQRGMKTALGLDFQLDGIDYGAANFVHADMDPETFFRKQREKGEGILTMLLRTMEAEAKLREEGKLRPMTLVDLVRIFASDDSSRTLKYLFAKQLESMDAVLESLEGEDGSVIVAERNKVAIAVLRDELAKGRRRVAIFYGAAHMADMERRLADELGFRKVSAEWVTAWDVGSRKPRPQPRRLRI